MFLQWTFFIIGMKEFKTCEFLDVEDAEENFAWV